LFLSEIVGAVKGKNLTPVPCYRGGQMAICVFAQYLAVAGTATEKKRHFQATKIKSQQQRSLKQQLSKASSSNSILPT
jgi:hypothetical protein